MHTFYDVIIIGGGPAGCAAATYLANFRKKCLLVDKGVHFGFMGSLPHVRYFPGLVESISGKVLIERLRKQATLNGAHVKTAQVTKQKNEPESISIFLSDGEKLQARTIIIASGASERTNYLPGEQQFLGSGVSYDVKKDGHLFHDRKIVVVGKNQTSVDAVLDLSKHAEKIFFVIPSNRLDASNKHIDQIQNEKKIETFFSSSVRKIDGSGNIESITIIETGKERQLDASGLFNYLHEFQPSTEFAKGEIRLSDKGTVLVDETLSTSHPGCYAAGDVICGLPQNPAISTAQGLIAAQSALKFLS
ncbi:MAG: FAD-dependent oxidoreductase [Pseudomonadota bacterium]